MRKQSVGIALGLGFVLMAFQNCSPTFLPEQTFQNNDHENAGKTREPEQYEGVIMPEDFAASGGAQGKLALVCPASGQKFSWPFSGVAYRDWIITNYVDNASAAGSMRDYTGAIGNQAVTYDGHMGLDIVVPNFRAMDGDFPVLASAAGTVLEVISTQADRNTSCATTGWNVVKIKHASGFVSIYGHLKKDSPVVRVGDQVLAGQKIGVVGSSGCSSAPHLHFQVSDCNRVLTDPMKEGMFVDAPVYTRQAPTTLMDTVVENPVISSIGQMLDPGGDPMKIPLNQSSSLGMTVAALKLNEELSISILRADQTEIYNLKMVAAKGYAQSHWWFNFTPRSTGQWTARYRINGREVFSRPLNVE